ncbi:hypothetical protein [Modestobacter sp. VKM Ac-2978]|uniref:hypothetical protein n=1 Tax=Modestobacter sp. VKM Ac-2978 TaxID=3004132 RepID=UPI0022AA3872|nr:hypothetical protein [Modestobacter sp. VKM Ac-2978]MCZ2847954.1 hypothetical protein [Modestobacter sp. VKM Ac-2978]
MTDPDSATDGVRAAEVYEATLQPRPGGRVLRSARLAAAFVSELAWGLVPGPSLHDVVVTRRADGAEVLRVWAGDPMDPGDMLAQVRRQLAERSPADFLAEWGADEPV